MTISKAFEPEAEALPEAFARHRHSFGGAGLRCLIVFADGSGLVATPSDDLETVTSERLSSAEMLAEVMAVFGVEALKRIQ